MAGLVLVVTALEDVTADRVIGALNEREVPVVRVDPADIGPQLSFGVRIGAGAPISGGRLRTASREVELGEVAAVYYRRPTPYVARSQHLPVRQRDFAATEARHGLGGVLNHLHGVRYVNHPGAVTAADFKPAQPDGRAPRPGHPGDPGHQRCRGGEEVRRRARAGDLQAVPRATARARHGRSSRPGTKARLRRVSSRC
jgi:hypothetical protein